MSRVLFFPSSSSRASFSIARARLFALAIFFHPLFLFSLRFKVVIFSRPPFFQPVLRFVSLLIFFFGCSCAFIFEVQGLPLLLEYFLSISSSWTRISSSTLFLLLIFYLFVLSKLFPPDPLVALLFPFISIFIVFHLQLLAAPETSYPSFFISNSFFVFSFLFFLSSYKLYIQLFLSINLVSFSYFTFCRSLHREFRLPSSFLLSHVYILLLGVSSLKCRALQALQSHLVIQLSEVEEGEYPFSLSFCAIHVQSSWRAIITKWTKREVLLTSSWHEPCGPSFAVSRKTCLHFYIFANVRR